MNQGKLPNPITQQMLAHRSIRQYTEESVSEEMLTAIVQCGQSAATSSFIQAYSVVHVTNTDKRAQIAKAAGGQVWVEKAPVFLVLCADLRRINYCSEKEDLGELEGHAEHFLTATADVALMAQNMMLSAESMGLGSVFIGGIRNDPALVTQLLELPKHVIPAFGMCIGWPHPDTDQIEVKPRLPVSAILHQDTYQTDQVESHVDRYDEDMQAYYAARSQNQRSSNWSAPTAKAVQQKKREHMRDFLQSQGVNRK